MLYFTIFCAKNPVKNAVKTIFIYDLLIFALRLAVFCSQVSGDKKTAPQKMTLFFTTNLSDII